MPTIISCEDVIRIKELSKHINIYNKFINSISPSIYGYYALKEIILLQLFMGNNKQIDDTFIRGGINVLLAGDEHTGKSTIKNNIQKLCINNNLEILTEINKETLKNKANQSNSLLCISTLKDYNHYRYPMENIGLSDDILSLFDIIYILKDDNKNDFEKTKFILDSHNNEKTKYEIDPLLFKKYICYSQLACKPKLSDEAKERITDFYVSSRKDEKDNNEYGHISAKTLESLIRLAEASAKIRLNNNIDEIDVNKAIKLICFSLTNAYSYNPFQDNVGGSL